MSEPTVDLARRMPHPWCRDVSRDEAIRAAEDDAANWRRLEVGEVVQDGDEYRTKDGDWLTTTASGRTVREDSQHYRRRRVPLPDHRDLPQAVKELRERVARLEAVAQPRPEPTTGSESVTPAIDPGPGWRLLADDEVIEQGDEWLRPPVHLNVWEPTSVSQGGVQTPKTMDEVYRRRVEVKAPQLSTAPPTSGLRTERVTLEITLSEAGQRALAMVGEMLSRFPVRVVEASNEADVAGMEYRGNSVGYWYAKAESYRQVVRDCRQQLAAVGGETLAQAAARLTAERDAAIRERDAAREECERLRAILPPESERGQGVGEGSWAVFACKAVAERDEARALHVKWVELATQARIERERLKSRVAELEAAAAANAGGEQQEPVAYMVVGKTGNVWGYAKEKGHFTYKNTPADSTVVPLYTAPQPPRGWLTEEERALVESLRATFQQNADALRSTGLGGHVDNWERKVRLFDAILARSTPPKVKLPEAFVAVVEAYRDGVIAAIRAAGGEVE